VAVGIGIMMIIFAIIGLIKVRKGVREIEETEFNIRSGGALQFPDFEAAKAHERKRRELVLCIVIPPENNSV
jgi:hypothetical protein